jgi:hypothetical protein
MSDSQVDPVKALRNARLYYAAYTINVLSYGIYVVLALMGIQLLMNRIHKQKISLVYSIVMFSITTAWFITNTKTNEILLIEETYNQAYKFSLYCSSTNIAATALSAILIMGSDLLLIYRTYIIWDRRFIPIVLPFTAWLAFIGIAIVGNLSCTPLIADIQNINAIVVAYYSLSVGCNAYCTLAICGKLFWHQRVLRQHNINSDADYHFMTSIIAESGFFYAVAGVVNTVLTVNGDPLSNISSAIFTALSYITQAQIILRVALGVDLKSTTDHNQTVSTAMAFGDRYGRQGTQGTAQTGTTANGSDVWREKGDQESGNGVRVHQ